jgi:hypothetical protein
LTLLCVTNRVTPPDLRLAIRATRKQPDRSRPRSVVVPAAPMRGLERLRSEFVAPPPACTSGPRLVEGRRQRL